MTFSGVPSGYGVESESESEELDAETGSESDFPFPLDSEGKLDTRCEFENASTFPGSSCLGRSVSVCVCIDHAEARLIDHDEARLIDH